MTYLEKFCFYKKKYHKFFTIIRARKPQIHNLYPKNHASDKSKTQSWNIPIMNRGTHLSAKLPMAAHAHTHTDLHAQS